LEKVEERARDIKDRERKGCMRTVMDGMEICICLMCGESPEDPITLWVAKMKNKGSLYLFECGVGLPQISFK